MVGKKNGGDVVVRSSSILILVAVVSVVTSVLLNWRSTQIMVTRQGHHVSTTLQVPPGGYSHQEITFYSGMDTHYSFAAEGGTINYTLLDAGEFYDWNKGQISPEWINHSNHSGWNMSGFHGDLAVPSIYYLFHNNDSYSRTIYFQSYKSWDYINYLYAQFGFLSFLLGIVTLGFGLYKRQPMSEQVVKKAKSRLVTAGGVLVIVASYVSALDSYSALTSLLIPPLPHSFIGIYLAYVRSLLVIGVFALFGFAFGLAAGIQSLRRKHFALAVVGTFLLMITGISDFLMINGPYGVGLGSALVFGAPEVILSLVGLIFVAVRKQEFT